MAREVEIKYRTVAPAVVQRALADAGAARIGVEIEDNVIFDSPQATLRNAGCALRLRTARDVDTGKLRAELTWKGPRAPGPMKIREEINTQVDDPQAARSIIEALGFRATVRYEKRRESWHLDRCEVVVDELPVVGWFVEIESLAAADAPHTGEEAVARCAARLGLRAEDIEPSSYVSIAARLGTSIDGAQTLRF